MNTENAIVKTSEEVTLMRREHMVAMGVVERAISNPSISEERILIAIEFRHRLQAEYAEKCFNVAMAQMQPKLPIIEKNSTIEIKDKSGNVIQKTPFADWNDINKVIVPILSEHGFSINFLVGTAEDGKVKLTTEVRHIEGHKMTTTVYEARDTSGSKNNTQGLGSTVTYLRRYTGVPMLNITSLAPEEKDTDGNQPVEMIDAEKVKTINDLLAKTKSDETIFLSHFGIPSVAEMPTAKYEDAIKALKAKQKRNG